MGPRTGSWSGHPGHGTRVIRERMPTKETVGDVLDRIARDRPAGWEAIRTELRRCVRLEAQRPRACSRDPDDVAEECLVRAMANDGAALRRASPETPLLSWGRGVVKHVAREMARRTSTPTPSSSTPSSATEGRAAAQAAPCSHRVRRTPATAVSGVPQGSRALRWVRATPSPASRIPKLNRKPPPDPLRALPGPKLPRAPG